MKRHPLGKFALLLGLLALLTNAGCAAYSSQISPLYEPVTFTRKGSGDLYLLTSATNPAADASAIRWVIGSVTNRDGQKIDDLLSTMPPAGMVQDALSQELRRAGYNIIPVTTAPPAPGKCLISSRCSSHSTRYRRFPISRRSVGSPSTSTSGKRGRW